MSNWLAPDCARAAIATASPATGTAADVEADDAAPVALCDDVAAARAEKPKFGTAAGSVFAAAVACAVDVPAVAEAAARSGAFAAVRSLVAAAAGSN